MLRLRLRASSGAARTAQTPEAGLGSRRIKPQSPEANNWGWPSTARLGSVQTRPLRGSQGRPLAANQGGASEPVQAKSAGVSGPTRRLRGIPASASRRSPARLAAGEPRCSCSERSSKRG